MLHHQHAFDQTNDPSRSFQVPHIGFYRSNRQRVIDGAVPAECFRECRGLNGIPHRRARAVGFHESHRRGMNPRIRTSIPHQLGLGPGAGQGNTVRVAVLI